ncbi:ribonuclease P protein component [Patulibacter sp.]|uniref:ribonuclease P protein component n=1 Tax=Patulibacter sp. TaxID=1912859 RepID=UPI00271C7BBE|nr:ribonuclease P protein component [Patulibacter sp.]MDO9410133.1 ribonuclease P protein component [Patulibacter sp.]
MPDPRPAAPRSKRGRLTRSADFERVFRKGRSFGNRHLVLHLFPRDDADEARDPRVGLSVSRRVGGAVERNLVKRLLREAVNEHVDRLTAVDLVLVARPDALAVAERDGLTGIADALRELVDKAVPAIPAPDAPA